MNSSLPFWSCFNLSPVTPCEKAATGEVLDSYTLFKQYILKYVKIPWTWLYSERREICLCSSPYCLLAIEWMQFTIHTSKEGVLKLGEILDKLLMEWGCNHFNNSQKDISISGCTILNLHKLGSWLWRRKALVMVGSGAGRLDGKAPWRQALGLIDLCPSRPLSLIPTTWPESQGRGRREQGRCIFPGVSHWPVRWKAKMVETRDAH